jgi:hypothetical protein
MEKYITAKAREDLKNHTICVLKRTAHEDLIYNL